MERVVGSAVFAGALEATLEAATDATETVGRDGDKSSLIRETASFSDFLSNAGK